MIDKQRSPAEGVLARVSNPVFHSVEAVARARGLRDSLVRFHRSPLSPYRTNAKTNPGLAQARRGPNFSRDHPETANRRGRQGKNEGLAPCTCRPLTTDLQKIWIC
jgi:hypothetical protein